METTETKDESEGGIFLVDDEREFAELMGMLLEEGLGVKTHVFHNPKDALRALESARPRFFISDHSMPHMDGFDLLREISLRRPDLPCVLMTGNLLDLDYIEARRSASTVEVLSKPVSWRVLAEHIRNHTSLGRN